MSTDSFRFYNKPYMALCNITFLKSQLVKTKCYALVSTEVLDCRFNLNGPCHYYLIGIESVHRNIACTQGYGSIRVLSHIAMKVDCSGFR